MIMTMAEELFQQCVVLCSPSEGVCFARHLGAWFYFRVQVIAFTTSTEFSFNNVIT